MTPPSPADPIKNDYIFPLTRIISGAVVPFLLLAFLILYVSPQPTGRWFAWDINPRMTAAYMGAGYLGGAYLLSRAVIGNRWHRVSRGYLPITAFTLSMLIVTLIHWERFELTHIPFLVWLALYIVTPVLISWIWRRNRITDPEVPDEEDAIVPSIVRWILAALGVILLAFAVVGILVPSLSIQIWPWQLSPLTARVLAGWAALLGVGGLHISRDIRWSAWKIGLESIALWHFLVLVAAGFNRQDLKAANLINWYLIAVAVMLVGMIALYIHMQTRRRRTANTEPG